MDCGRYKSAVVDKEMKKIDASSDIPEELVEMYFDMVRQGMKARLAADGDYQAVKGSGRYSNLDQLFK